MLELSRADVPCCCTQAVAEGLGRVLDAIGTATLVIGMIQQHHTKVIQPQVQASAGETKACSSALAGLVRSTEERVLACLQSALNAFCAQVVPPYTLAHIAAVMSAALGAC